MDESMEGVTDQNLLDLLVASAKLGKAREVLDTSDSMLSMIDKYPTLTPEMDALRVNLKAQADTLRVEMGTLQAEITALLTGEE